jgi:hypothetical protein
MRSTGVICTVVLASLYGPISAEHTKSLQQFSPVMERKRWEELYKSKPTDYVLQIAWHKARATCRCVNPEMRRQSNNWLDKRNLGNISFNVKTGRVYK